MTDSTSERKPNDPYGVLGQVRSQLKDLQKEIEEDNIALAEREREWERREEKKFRVIYKRLDSMIEKLDNEEWALVPTTADEKELAAEFSDEKSNYLLAELPITKRRYAYFFLRVLERARDVGILRPTHPKDLVENAKLKEEIKTLVRAAEKAKQEAEEAKTKYEFLDKVNRDRFQSDVKS